MRTDPRYSISLAFALLLTPMIAGSGSAAARQQPGTGPAQAAAVGPTDAATRMRAWEQHQRMEAESPFADLEWRAVGPRMQGGRIESIDVPAGSDSTIYVGVGSGNLWKTTNNGTTWRPIFEKQSSFAIGDVTIAPSNPEIVWVGTGEVLMARSSYAGTGVFKSTDAGETWRNMGLTDSHHIARVLIHPDDPDTVWVAAIGHLYSDNPERGVYRTTDGGVTWERVLYVDERTGAIELVADPADPDTLYAAMWERSRKAWGHTTNGPGSGVYKSTDGGTTWQQLGDGMGGGAGLPVGDHIGRIGLAVAPSNPAVVYALVDNYAPDPSPPADQEDRGPRRIGGEIYRSDDRGETWRKVNEEPIPAGYDFCLIRVAPDDENIVYLPNNRFWVSEDGGRTTRQIEGTLVHLLPHGSRVLHLDMHDLWIDPDDGDHMLLGNDGGLHLSYDRGASWLHLNNLPIGEFYAVAVDMDEPYNIYGGTQDDAALFGASDQVIEDDLGDRWSHVYLDRWGGGDSYFTYRDELDPDLIYYEHQFGDLRRKRMSTGETVRIRPQAAEGEPELRRNWMTPFFISDHDPLTLYYGANVLYKSLDRGDTWSPISPDLTSRPAAQGNVPWGTLTTVAESPLRPGLLYTGADDGTMHVTRDDGATWAPIGAGLPERWVTRMTASRHHEATVYASLTGYRYDEFDAHVFVSEDYGATWRSIVGNLPAEPVNVIAEDPEHAGILYVGTDTGVYVSIDHGATWHALCANLPTTPVYDLVVHPRDAELIIGTHGRSIFVLDVEPIRRVGGAARTGRRVAAAAAPSLPLAQEDETLREWNHRIRREKFDLVVPEVMRNNGVDMWIHVMRESIPDPFGAEDLGSTSGVFVFTDGGGERIERAILGRRWGDSHAAETWRVTWETRLVEESGAYDIIGDPVLVRQPPGGPETEYDYRFEGLREFVAERDPQRIAVNFVLELGPYPTTTRARDGLSHTDFLLLSEELGAPYAERMMSSERLVMEYVATPVPSEVELLRELRADEVARVTAAFEQIVPGTTTNRDVRLTVFRRRGNGVSQRGRTPGHETVVIEGGDIVAAPSQGMYAYVLRDGETEPPAEIQEMWAKYRMIDGILAEQVRAGRTGREIVDSYTEILEREGMVLREVQLHLFTPRNDFAAYSADYEPGTTHLNIDLHAMGKGARERKFENYFGPRIGSNGPEWMWDIPLPPNHHFVLEYFIYMPWPSDEHEDQYLFWWDHEQAIATESGVEYLSPPQQDLYLIR